MLLVASAEQAVATSRRSKTLQVSDAMSNFCGQQLDVFITKTVVILRVCC